MIWIRRWSFRIEMKSEFLCNFINFLNIKIDEEKKIMFGAQSELGILLILM